MLATAAQKNELLSEEEYFAAEELTEDAHEYLGGRVYAMSVPTDVHGTIQQNLGTALHLHLRGQRCRAWMGNMRVRIALLPLPIHYIPDVLVSCDDPPPNDHWRAEPVAIFEVLSLSTERIDRREKLLAYTQIPSLRHYFLVRQDRMEVTHLRRVGEGWDEFVFTHPVNELEIAELGWRLSLGALYESVEV